MASGAEAPVVACAGRSRTRRPDGAGDEPTASCRADARAFMAALSEHAGESGVDLPSGWRALGGREPLADPEAAVAAQELRRRVEHVLRRLSARHRRIVAMRFGLLGLAPMSVAEIAEVEGCCPVRVRQIQDLSLERLGAWLGVHVWRSRRRLKRASAGSDGLVAASSAHHEWRAIAPALPLDTLPNVVIRLAAALGARAAACVPEPREHRWRFSSGRAVRLCFASGELDVTLLRLAAFVTGADGDEREHCSELVSVTRAHGSPVVELMGRAGALEAYRASPGRDHERVVAAMERVLDDMHWLMGAGWSARDAPADTRGGRAAGRRRAAVGPRGRARRSEDPRARGPSADGVR